MLDRGVEDLGPVVADVVPAEPLVDQAAVAAGLRARVDELAEQIADASPLTLEIGKQAFYRQIDLPQDEAYREMAGTMETNAVTCDAQEGITAFLEKRTPTWTGT